LIIYTYLNREFVDDLMSKVPELKSIFSLILCREDTVPLGDYLVKDIGLLLSNRKIEEVIVVDINS